MLRIFIEKGWLQGDRILLPNRERHYLANVLRLGPGGMFQAVLDGEAEMEAVLEQIKPNAVAKILERRPVQEEKGLSITLLQAQLKAPRMAWLVQKATELGVNSLTLFISERTIPRPKYGGDSLERWKTIAREAAEQCGATKLPQLEGPLPFSQVLESCEGDNLRLLLWEGEAPPLRGILHRVERAERIFLAVGPEGGFAPAEVEMAKVAGFTPVSLGKRILRAETAALAALAILRLGLGNG